MSHPNSQLPQFLVIGFSGHRRLADPTAISRTIATVIERLRREIPYEWIALSSIAEGGDQLFMTEARRLGLAWHAILPLEAAEFSKDFDSGTWTIVEEMLSAAEHVRVIERYGAREDGYLDCGIETVDGSDVLIAVWDGEPARGKGGTAEVIAYSRELSKPLIIIDAVDHTVRYENFNRLRPEDHTLAVLNRIPFSANNPPATNGISDSIAKFMAKCDRSSSTGAPRFRQLTTSIILLNLMVPAIGIVEFTQNMHGVSLPYLKLLCLSSAFGLAIVLRKSGYQRERVRARLAAEFCRSALSTWGLPRTVPLFRDIDIPEMRGLARTLRILHIRSGATRSKNIDDFKYKYLRERLEGHIAYYSRQLSQTLILHSRLKIGFWAMSVLGILCTIFVAAAPILGLSPREMSIGGLIAYLSVLLPSATAVALSLVSINDLNRRSIRAQEMVAILEQNRATVIHSLTWNSVERAVLRTERALIGEILHWHSLVERPD